MFKDFKVTDDTTSRNVLGASNIEIFPVLNAEALFEEERRKKWRAEIFDLIATSSTNYNLYYLPVIINFAEFVQNLPETRNGFYSHHGGFLDHGLERTVLSMRLSQGYVEADAESGTPEEQRGLWTYAIYSASLLFDVGKLATKLIITLRQNTKRFRVWNPFEGSMLKLATDYSYEFAAENFDTLRRQVTPMLAKQLMPEMGFAWLSSDKDILSAWFELLQEDYRQVSPQMTVLPLADAEILETYYQKYEKNLAEKVKMDKFALFKDPALILKSTEASKLSRVHGLFYEGRVSDGKEGVISSVVGGEAFLSWLKKSIANGKLSVNLANSGVHVTNEGVLLLSKVFQDFTRDNPVYGDWRDIRKQFEQLEITKELSAAQNQAFRHYVTVSESKLLSEVTLVTNRYIVFLQSDKIPGVNPNIIPVATKAETLPPRPENISDNRPHSGRE